MSVTFLKLRMNSEGPVAGRAAQLGFRWAHPPARWDFSSGDFVPCDPCSPAPLCRRRSQALYIKPASRLRRNGTRSLARLGFGWSHPPARLDFPQGTSSPATPDPLATSRWRLAVPASQARRLAFGTGRIASFGDRADWLSVPPFHAAFSAPQIMKPSRLSLRGGGAWVSVCPPARPFGVFSRRAGALGLLPASPAANAVYPIRQQPKPLVPDG